MNKKIISIFVVSLSLVLSLLTNISALDNQSYEEPAESKYLGVAGNFNVFTLEDLRLYNTDSEGRVAVGGKADFSGFGVGANMPISQDRFDLIVNGDLSIASGENASGNTLVNKNSLLSKFGFGHKNNNQNNPYKMDTDKFFKDAQEELYTLTDKYSKFSISGDTYQEQGALKMKGEDAKVNVFEVDADMLGCSNGIWIDVVDGSTTIINVRGEHVSFPSCGVFYNGQSGGGINSKANTILWNFPEAKTITANGMSILGSVLAPYAHSTLQNGHINGSLIVKSHEGQYESHLYLFNPPHFIEDDEVVRIPVKKVWDDEDNLYGTRPLSITIKLFANGEDTHKSLSLEESIGWSASFDNLEKYDSDGIKIVYEIKEEYHPDYESDISGDMNTGFVVTNKLTSKPVEYTNVSVEKVWEDYDNLYATRPDEVKMYLYVNGENSFLSLTMNEGSNWFGSFDGLPKRDANDNLIVYTIVEKEAPVYETVVTGDMFEGFTVTNTYTREIEKTEIPVQKVWENDDSSTRPENITVVLYEDYKETDQRLILDETNAWKGTFSNLDKTKEGRLIHYSIKEIEVEGYSSTITKVMDNGFIITNTKEEKEIEKIEIPVKKTWDDLNNKHKLRPDFVIVKLFADGTDTNEFLELNESNNLSGSFTNLDKTKDDQDIVYTIEEVSVAGYDSFINGDMSTGFELVNRLIEEPEERMNLSVRKVWDDGNRSDRPEKITVRLIKDGDYDHPIMTKEISGLKDHWTVEFKDLLKYKDGVRINYTIVEDYVSNYKSKVERVSAEEIVLVNTYEEPEVPTDPEEPKEPTKPELPKSPTPKTSVENYTYVYMLMGLIGFIVLRKLKHE